MTTVNYFLKLDGLDGASVDPKSLEQMPIDSWDWSAATPAVVATGSGAAVGRPTFHDFRFTRTIDKASIPIFLAFANGQSVRTATLMAFRPGAQPFGFLTLIFSNARITSYAQGAAPGAAGGPVETVTLAYLRIEIQQREQKPDGSAGPPTIGGWDLAANHRI